MAFHPLRSFRRHQKTWLAGLTILSMLSFVVLGSLQGMVPYFARIFGGNNSPTVVELYGKEIDKNTLQMLRIRREAANEYVFSVVESARQKAIFQVMQDSKDWNDPRAAQAVQGLFQFTGGMNQLPYYAMVLNPNVPREARLDYLGKAYGEVSALQSAAASTNKSKEAEDLAVFAQSILSAYPVVQREKNETYFGGKLDAQGLADFILLRDQADHLGISLDDDGVKELLREESFNQFSSDDLRLAASRAQQKYERVLPQEDWDAALRDEFRVRLAKEALLGYDPDHPTPGYDMSTMGGHQALTPYSLWHRYEQVRGESQIGLVPIKADSKQFLDKVQPPTKPAELQSFFEKYKNQPDNPDSPQAGFMTPAQYAFEWVGARMDAPYFKQKTEAQLPAKLAALVATGNQILTPALPDQDVANWLSKVQLLNDTRGVDQSVRAAVAALATDTVTSAAPIAGAAMLETSLYSARMDHATLPAFDATIVALAGTPRCGIVPAAAWLQYTDINKRFLPPDVAMAAAYREFRQDNIATTLVQQALDEVRQDLEARAQLMKASDGGDFERLYQPAAGHVPAVVDLLLAQLAASSPAGPAAAATLAAPASRQLTETMQARGQLATRLLAAGNDPFALTNVAAQELSPPVRLMQAPIASAIRKYGLDHAAMPQPLDRSKLARDPALAPLKTALTSSSGEGDNTADESAKFANRLVGQPGGQVDTRVYFPQSGGQPDGEQFLYWPTAVVDRRVPSYAEVRERVKARWTLEQARKEAQKAAEQMAKEVSEHKGSSANVVDVVKQVTGATPAITLDRVAPLSRPEFPSPMTSRAGPYQRYQVPVTSGLKPGGDFVNKILELKEPGDATVVHDASEMTYYVAVLENRRLPSETAFRTDYVSPVAYAQVVQAMDSSAEAQHTQLGALLETLRDRANLQITPEGRDAFKAGRQ